MFHSILSYLSPSKSRKNTLENSLIEIEKTLIENPYDVEANENKGIILYKLGRYVEAIEFLSKYIEEKDPNNNKILCYLGLSLKENNQFDEALKILDRSIIPKMDREFGPVNLAIGEIYYELSNYSLAFDYLELADDTEGRKVVTADRALYYEIMYKKGVCKSNLGYLKEALEYFIPVSRHPTFSTDDVKYLDLLYKIVKCQLDSGEYKQAIETFNKIIELNFVDVKASFNKGIAILKLGTPYIATLKILESSNNSIKNETLIEFFNSGITALREFSQVNLVKSEGEISDTELHNNIGLAQFYSGQFAEANKSFSEAIEYSPDGQMNGFAYYNRAVTLYILAENANDSELIAKAAECIDKALSLPFNGYKPAQCYNMMGKILELQNKSQEALKFFLTACSIDDETVNIMEVIEFLIDYGKKLASSGDLNEALQIFKSAAKLYEDNNHVATDLDLISRGCEIYLILGNIVADRGENFEAFKYYNKVIFYEEICQNNGLLSQAYLGKANVLGKIGLPYNIVMAHYKNASTYNDLLGIEYLANSESIENIFKENLEDGSSKNDMSALILHYKKLSQELLIIRHSIITDTVNYQLKTDIFKAIQTLDEINLENPFTNFQKAVAYYNSYDYNGAIKILSKEDNFSNLEDLLLANFYCVNVNILLGLAHHKLGDHLKAVKYFDTAIMAGSNYVFQKVEENEQSSFVQTLYTPLNIIEVINAYQKTPSNFVELLKHTITDCIDFAEYSKKIVIHTSNLELDEMYGNNSQQSSIDAIPSEKVSENSALDITKLDEAKEKVVSVLHEIPNGPYSRIIKLVNKIQSHKFLEEIIFKKLNEILENGSDQHSIEIELKYIEKQLKKATKYQIDIEQSGFNFGLLEDIEKLIKICKEHSEIEPIMANKLRSRIKELSPKDAGSVGTEISWNISLFQYGNSQDDVKTILDYFKNLYEYLEKYSETIHYKQQETLLNNLLIAIICVIDIEKQKVFLGMFQGEDIPNHEMEATAALPELTEDSNVYSSPFTFRNIYKSVVSYAVDYAKNQLSHLSVQLLDPKSEEKDQTSEEFLAAFTSNIMSLKSQSTQLKVIVMLSKLFDKVIKQDKELQEKACADELENIILKIQLYQQSNIIESQYDENNHQLKTLVIDILDKVSKIYSAEFLFNVTDEFIHLLHISNPQHIINSIVLLKRFTEEEGITFDDLNMLQSSLAQLRAANNYDYTEFLEKLESKDKVHHNAEITIASTDARLGGEIISNDME